MKPIPIPPSIFKPLKKEPDRHVKDDKNPILKLDLYFSSQFISTYFSHK